MFLSVLALSAEGCATRTQTGAAVGAAVGAGAGAAVGATKGGAQGAMIGAGVGAGVGLILGALVGRHWDWRTGDRTAAAKQADLVPMPTAGNVLAIKRYELVPPTARPGQIVLVRMDYFIMAMNPDQRVDLEEWRLMRRDGREVTERDYRRRPGLEQGVYTTEYWFQLLPNTPPGQYTILTILATEGQSRHQGRAEATLLVESPAQR
jgi:hypothetical protein